MCMWINQPERGVVLTDVEQDKNTNSLNGDLYIEESDIINTLKSNSQFSAYICSHTG